MAKKKDEKDVLVVRDEKTPHIHATIVPIVTGERRKARKEEQNGKKKYPSIIKRQRGILCSMEIFIQLIRDYYTLQIFG